MENDTIMALADVLAKSLDNTQQYAIDTEEAVQQILSMSGQEMHCQTVSAIFADASVGIEKKLELIHRETEEYDRRLENNTNRLTRLQEAQTQNIRTATHGCSKNWGWIALAGVVAFAFVIPEGQKMLASVTHRLAA